MGTGSTGFCGAGFLDVGSGTLEWRGWRFRDGLRGSECTTQAEGLPGVEETEEERQVGTPGEQAEDELATASDDLSGDEDEPLEEGAKVHAQKA